MTKPTSLYVGIMQSHVQGDCPEVVEISGIRRVFMRAGSSFLGTTYLEETALDVSDSMARHLVETGAAQWGATPKQPQPAAPGMVVKPLGWEQQKREVQASVNWYLSRGCAIKPNGEVFDKRGELVEVIDWPEGMEIELH